MIKQSVIVKRVCLKNFGLFQYTYADLTAQVVDVSKFGEVKQDEANFTSKTAVTGAASGYNVIEIMIETGTSATINETLTPNLYKLREEGINFTKNHSKNKTNISEFIGIVGSSTATVSNLLPQTPMSLPYVLSNKFDYETNYFHSNYASFYNRGIEMPNLGFDNSYFLASDKDRKKSYDESVKYVGEDLEWNNNYNGRYPYDYNYYEYIKDYLIPETDQPFYSFWTTLSMHGPYNLWNSLESYYGNEYSVLKEAEEAGLWTNLCDYTNDDVIIKQFAELQCKTMVLDKAIGYLLEDLEEKGILDNTLLILYGDHEAYYKVGIEQDLKFYIYNVCNENDSTIDDSKKEYYAPEYETFLTIYNKNVMNTIKKNINQLDGFSLENDKIKYNYFSSPYIIVPTVLDLLGIIYDSNNYLSKSIFQNNTFKYGLDNLFYSSELSLLFSDCCLSNGGNIVWEANGVSEEYKKEFNLSSQEILYKITNFETNYATGYYNSDEVKEDILSEYLYY